MTPNHIERPDYLIGTFDWRGLGYSFSNEPPEDLLNRQIRTDDPWNCIGQFLALCKSGRIPNTAVLQRIVMDDNTNEPLILQACYDLLGDAAGRGEIKFFDHLIRYGSKNQKLSASWASQWTASLDLLPALLSAYKSFTRTADKETIAAVISNMLEREGGDDDLELYDYTGDEESYSKLVLQHANDLIQQWPNCKRFYSGMPLDIVSLVTRFRATVADMIHNDKVPQESLIVLRRWFEASTGTDCSQMFVNRRFSPQAALDILEKWFNSNTIQYSKGVKYFFGVPCLEG
jgi:hypothetical protein